MTVSPTTEFPCPYVLGATFSLEISPPQGPPFVAEAKVDHVYSPFTMSSAMKVTLTSQSTSTMLPAAGEAILKIYDRRFANSVRKDFQVGPPSYERETRYAEYLRSDSVVNTEDEIYDAIDTLEDDAPENTELDEHLLTIYTKSLWENEKKTYGVLSSLQGKYIPTFYGTTRFLDDLDGSSPGLDTAVPGILVEFIPGTSLDDIDPTGINVDTVCSTGVDIVNLYSDLNVLNSDMRLGNFIVKPSGSEIVMIDFGNSRLRSKDEDDEAWKKEKWEMNEEGHFGRYARERFGWSYVRSRRYAPSDYLPV